MAQQCPKCGGFDISPETDRFHCLDCGEFFTFDNVEAKDGPAPEPLFVPEERVDAPEVVPEPTDHDALAQDAQTGTEGIDTGPAPEVAPEAAPEAAPEPAPVEEVALSGKVVSQPAESTPEK